MVTAIAMILLAPFTKGDHRPMVAGAKAVVVEQVVVKKQAIAVGGPRRMLYRALSPHRVLVIGGGEETELRIYPGAIGDGGQFQPWEWKMPPMKIIKNPPDDVLREFGVMPKKRGTLLNPLLIK
jgi:hypothetical protein